MTQPGLELPPGISPALVTLVPGTAVAKDIPAEDTIIPGWDGSLRLCHERRISSAEFGPRVH